MREVRHPGLAGARAGQRQHRAFERLDRLALFRIEGGEPVRRAACCRKGARGNASRPAKRGIVIIWRKRSFQRAASRERDRIVACNVVLDEALVESGVKPRASKVSLKFERSISINFNEILVDLDAEPTPHSACAAADGDEPVQLEHFRRKLTGFGQNKRGAVAVMFALALIGIGLAVGLTLDYSRALQAKTTLKSAADAAALAALSAVETDYVNNVSSAQMILDAKSAAQLAFVANSGKYYSELAPSGSNATCGNPCVNVTINGLNVVATVGFQAYSSNLFGALANSPTMNISQSDNKASIAQETLPAYANFYLLLDNTPSMGVGATSTDIQNLINLTTNLTATVNGKTYNNPNEAQCGFACHQVHPCSAPSPPSDCGTTAASKSAYETNVYAPKFDYLTISRNNNVTLRIDALRQATQNLMSLAANIESANHMPNELQFAVYSFGASADAEQSCALAKIAPPSASGGSTCNADASVSGDTGALATQAQALDLMATQYQNQYGDQDTSFDTVVPALPTPPPRPRRRRRAKARRRNM